MGWMRNLLGTAFVLLCASQAVAAVWALITLVRCNHCALAIFSFGALMIAATMAGSIAEEILSD